MKVKFDKEVKNTCKCIKPNKEYDVICEYQSTVVVKDDAGVVCGYPKAWVEEWCQ